VMRLHLGCHSHLPGRVQRLSPRTVRTVNPPNAHTRTRPPYCFLSVDVVITDPSKSLLLEIKGAELTRSDAFLAGYTMRFPRVVKIRSDKVRCAAAVGVLSGHLRGGG
jgi:ATP-dependent DNA ligase